MSYITGLFYFAQNFYKFHSFQLDFAGSISIKEIFIGKNAFALFYVYTLCFNRIVVFIYFVKSTITICLDSIKLCID